MRPFISDLNAADADALRHVRTDAYERGLATAHMPHLFYPIYGSGRGSASFDAMIDAPPIDRAPADIRRLVLAAESEIRYV